MCDQLILAHCVLCNASVARFGCSAVAILVQECVSLRRGKALRATPCCACPSDAATQYKSALRLATASAEATQGNAKMPRARAAAVEVTLRKVWAYMQDHEGRLPSQLDPEAKRLYFKFRKLRKRSMPTARAASLLWAITCAQGARRAGSRGRLSTANFRSVAAARSICRRS